MNVEIYFRPTRNYKNNLQIMTDGKEITCWNAERTTKLETICIYDVKELYNHLESIVLRTKEANEQWTCIRKTGQLVSDACPDYFSTIPVLSSLQAVLDEINPNKDENIIIEI